MDGIFDHDLLNTDHYTLKQAYGGKVESLLGAFLWAETQEGPFYWADVYVSGEIDDVAKSILKEMLDDYEKTYELS